MKKILWVIFVALSLLFVGCNHGADLGSVDFPANSGSENSVETPPDDNAVFYSITYQWDEYGTVYDGIENFPKAMTNGISVPTRYEEGKTLALPQLNTWKKNPRNVYEFEGWYYDSDLKNKVSNGVLPDTQTGNITLYARCIAYVR